MHEQELLKLFAMLALGMEETHTQGFVHRNLSSSHVYLDNDGHIARLANHANITYKELMEKELYCNQFWCERFYLSPLAFAGEKYGPKDDIWALGVLIIEMATLYHKPQYDPRGKN